MGGTVQSENDSASGLSCRIAGFWERLFALLIDELVLGILGFCLGLILCDYFAALGVWGRAIGFIIAMGYFGVMNSRICRGQTIGKVLMKIRVADGDGRTLRMGTSFLRSGVLVFPYFLWGLSNPPEPEHAGSFVFNEARVSGDPHLILQSWFMVVALVLEALKFGVGTSLVYLFIFNRKTRQSLHDLIVGSYVVKAEPAGMPPAVRAMWRGHYAVVALIALVAIAAPIPIFTSQHLFVLANTESFVSLLPLQKALTSEPGIQHATVAVRKERPISGEKGKQSQSYVSVHVTTSGQNANPDALADYLARITLKSYPNAAAQDLIEVSISYGYDIGIASAWQRRSYAFSPTQWRQRLEPKLKP